MTQKDRSYVAEDQQRTDRPLDDPRHEFVDMLEYAYGPILVAIAFAFFIASVDASHEVILSLAFDAATAEARAESWPRLVATVLLFLAVPFVLRKSLDRVLKLRGADHPEQIMLDRIILTVVPLLPVFGAFVGITRTFLGTEAAGAEGALFVAALLLFVPLYSPAYDLVSRWRHKGLRMTEAEVDAERARAPWRLRWFIPVLLPLYALAVLFPSYAHHIGPIAIASIFVMLASVFLAGLTVLSSRTRTKFPLILTLVILVYAGDVWWFAAGIGVALLLIEGLLWLYRDRKADRDRPVLHWGTVGAAAAFLLIGGISYYGTEKCGLAAGCNIVEGAYAGAHAENDYNAFAAVGDWYEPDAGPMRIVAAQGGGLYAAYHTAYFLAAATDDPATGEDFANSLFAISGVSGGSVGAAVYWAIRRSKVCDDLRGVIDDCYRQAVKQVLREDYLSPPLTSLLFRDLTDTIVPYTVFVGRPIDRGQVLLNAFDAQLAGCCTFDLGNGETLTVEVPAGLLDTALPNSFGEGVPLLFLNATDVQTGESVIASPVDAFNEDQVSARVRLDNGNDLTVGQAMLNSARFPLVSPPGRYVEEGRIKQIVDGGYFDNSGIETVAEILRGIEFGRLFWPQSKGSLTPIEVEVITFGIRETRSTPTMNGTLTAPVAAFQSAWIARRSLTADRFCDRWEINRETNARNRGLQAMLRPDTYNFTVSWLLTQSTFDDIEAQIEADLRQIGGGLTEEDMKALEINPCLGSTYGLPRNTRPIDTLNAPAKIAPTQAAVTPAPE